jgi:hypothetical protein
MHVHLYLSLYMYKYYDNLESRNCTCVSSISILTHYILTRKFCCVPVLLPSYLGIPLMKPSLRGRKFGKIKA